MLNINLRKAIPTDLENLIILENTCFTSDRLSRRHLRDHLKKNSAEILIAEADNRIIAAAVMHYRKNSKKVHLYSFAVHPDYRRSGVASALNAYLEKNAILRHANQLILEVRQDNISAINFYLKNGYKHFGTYTHFYEDGTDAYRMKKDLM